MKRLDPVRSLLVGIPSLKEFPEIVANLCFQFVQHLLAPTEAIREERFLEYNIALNLIHDQCQSSDERKTVLLAVDTARQQGKAFLAGLYTMIDPHPPPCNSPGAGATPRSSNDSASEASSSSKATSKATKSSRNLTKRALQNKEAQRTLRERRAKQIAELEAKVKELEEASSGHGQIQEQSEVEQSHESLQQEYTSLSLLLQESESKAHSLKGQLERLHQEHVLLKEQVAGVPNDSPLSWGHLQQNRLLKDSILSLEKRD
ncbi:hypothetical protein BDR26DRAFT_631411 [Obelidium mucronatum]|nr:hypothetical protein BDR26DRAFT_631411 [Obelidium mucronatum]